MNYQGMILALMVIIGAVNCMPQRRPIFSGGVAPPPPSAAGLGVPGIPGIDSAGGQAASFIGNGQPGSASAGGSGAALIQNGVAIGQGTGTAQAGPGGFAIGLGTGIAVETQLGNFGVAQGSGTANGK